jgi:sugar/nucleoside kinase (ribokinase family)
MTPHVFGSITIDHVYRLAWFPQSGETLASNAYAVGLGGKGANEARAADFKPDSEAPLYASDLSENRFALFGPML